ncbi:hypothetical protein ACUXQ2_004734 [Cupriavidus metallidurans]
MRGTPGCCAASQHGLTEARAGTEALAEDVHVDGGREIQASNVTGEVRPSLFVSLAHARVPWKTGSKRCLHRKLPHPVRQHHAYD